MVEHHGWATIRLAYTCEDTELEELNRLAEEIKRNIFPSEWPFGSPSLEYHNTAWHLSVFGFTNHAPQTEDDPVRLFREISRVAPGSYGLLYIHDDESFQDGYDNEFVAYVMARGEVKQARDPFLSPYIPAVEDECRGP
ncbi:MAG TPA: Imm7 family immunity protein [Oscillatoriaceae cyanobacterium]